MVKIYPLLLLGYFALHRSWAALGAALATVAALIALCALETGWDLERQYWFDVLPHLTVGSTSLSNQSLLGFFGRFFLGANAAIPSDAASLAIPTLLARSVGLLALGVTAAVIFKHRQPEVAFVLLVPLLLMIHPAAWMGYEMLLLSPITVLVASLARDFRAGRAVSSGLAISLGLAILLLAFGSTQPIQNTTSPWLQSYKLYGVIGVWLVGLGWACGADRSAAEGADHRLPRAADPSV